MEQDPWLKKSEEILANVREWRRAHPKASFVEIEDEVHKRMMQLEAQVLQDAAQASTSREWGKTSGKPAVVCPKCAVPLQARGKHQPTLQRNESARVTLTRTSRKCPTLRTYFF